MSITSGPQWGFRVWPGRPDEGPVKIEGVPDHPVPPDVAQIDTGDPIAPTEPSVRTLLVGVQPPCGGIKDNRHYDWTIQVTLFFKPSRKRILDWEADNAKRTAERNAAKQRAYTEALYKSAAERVTTASKLEPRRFDELREEERIVVYRNLIRQLLEAAGVTDEDHRVRHVFAELVGAMFDVDRMLYSVAPDWWMPRQRNSPPAHGGLDVGLGDSASAFEVANTVSWGGTKELGTKEPRSSNYYVTGESKGARLGSSLGWLLQLDGDNLRNAFLNAPWVKAVIPIRPGREWDAMDWLSQPSIEDSDGLRALYQAANPDEKPAMLAALKGHT